MSTSNKTTFSISNQSNSNLINLGTPLNVSYLVGEKHTVDNTTGISYPNFAVVHKKVYETVARLDDLLNNDAEAPVYRQWTWDDWYSAGSLVYVYDEVAKTYRFYKSIKMANPIIPLTNTNYWNSYASQGWELDYDYPRGTVVHIVSNENYAFYECVKDANGLINIDNIEYWKPMNLNNWSYDVKYNIGSKVYSDDIVYTCIKTVLPVTRIDNREHWLPYFDHYALIKAASMISSDLADYISELNGLVTEFKSLFELDMDQLYTEQINALYQSMYDLHDQIQTQWSNIQISYRGITRSVGSDDGILWKNMYDADIYIKKLNLYAVDPIKVLESIPYLDSFNSISSNSGNKTVVAYVMNLHIQQDPAQKNGAYFIYDTNKKRFIKALVGQHDHRNKDILDEISQSFDEVSEEDTNSSIVLTIRKERPQGHLGMAWEYHPQWKNIDVLPDKPTDGKEYILKSDLDGNITWSDKLSSAIAFVKRERTVLADSPYVEFDIDLTFDDEGNIIDSILLFKNSLFVSNVDMDYSSAAKVLTLTLKNSEMFNTDDLLTLLVVRNTSAEMLSKLSDEYVSKKEAIEILSGGTINLRDYVKKDNLSIYSLKNHIHTRYASTDHSHWGVYANYYHNHDGLYITRDEVNEILGNILSVNPDLIDIISGIASDAENLQNTFVSRSVYDNYVSTTNQRLADLENVDETIVYMDTNTGRLSKRIDVNGSISFEPVDIHSHQIKTKYKVTDEPEETEVYNLEDWLDRVTVIVQTGELSVKKSYREVMKSDKVLKTITLDSDSDRGITLYNFNVTGLRLSVTELFDKPIRIMIDNEILVDEDEIIEDDLTTSSYDIDLILNTERKIEFDLGLSTIGKATLSISGYVI